MDELKELLEELLAAQLLDIALRLEARGARGGEPLPATYLQEAAALVRQNRQTLVAALRGPVEAAPEDDAPGQAGNLKKAKQMSLKQKRYDLQKGLF